MKEAYGEAPWIEGNSWMDVLLGKEPGDDDKPAKTDSGFLNIIGLCGMTKTTGKILKCLLAGVTIEDFMIY